MSILKLSVENKRSFQCWTQFRSSLQNANNEKYMMLKLSSGNCRNNCITWWNTSILSASLVYTISQWKWYFARYASAVTCPMKSGNRLSCVLNKTQVLLQDILYAEEDVFLYLYHNFPRHIYIAANKSLRLSPKHFLAANFVWLLKLLPHSTSYNCTVRLE